MTLRDVVRRAVEQNPDVTLAASTKRAPATPCRLPRTRSHPASLVGSGLAYSNGFPMSIEGSAPSIVQAHASQYLFNRPQSYAVAQAKEQVRGAGFDMADEKGHDYKILSVAHDDPRWERVHALEDISPHRLLEIENFFQTYKTLEKRQTDVRGWLGVDDAWRIIGEAVAFGARTDRGEETAEPGTWR